MKGALVCLSVFISYVSSAAESIVEDVGFTSGGITLSGSIVFPAGDIQAGVVFVHGSGKQTRNLGIARRFAQDGIATLVYDKRGVGDSGGEYESEQSVSEKNLTLLANDALAALQTLAKQPRLSGKNLGLTGISQAGWIVPLAAEATDLADFMVLWSGPVCRVSEEDIFSKYTADADKSGVPGYQEALEAREHPYVWPAFLGKDTDSSTSLDKTRIPGLWIFGAEDGSVPVDLSIERLEQLIDDGHDYEYILFSSLGHNNMQETFATATDWIKRTAK